MRLARIYTTRVRSRETRSLFFSQAPAPPRLMRAYAKQADARPDTNACQIGCPVRLMTARER